MNKTVTYDGKNKAAAGAKLTFNDQALGKTVTLTEGKDYVVTYKNNLKAGSATAIFTGKGIYSGIVRVGFKILPLEVSTGNSAKSTTGVTKGKKINIKLGSSYAHAKGGTKPVPEVYFVCNDGTRLLLTKGKDFKLTYKNFKVPGEGSITITFKGNFKGSLTYTYEITGN